MCVNFKIPRLWMHDFDDFYVCELCVVFNDKINFDYLLLTVLRFMFMFITI